MKKSLLFAGFAALALSASAQNPFAYGIHTDGVNTEGVATGSITVNYTLNANAESGSIVIRRAPQMIPVKTIALAGDQLTQGTHAVVVSLDGLPTNSQLGYTITTTGAKIDAAKEIFSDFSAGANHQYWSPYGVACDNNTNSKHFGRVLITESQNNQKNTYFSKAKGVGAGLYEYDPQGNPVFNLSGEKYGYCPFTWNAGKYPANASQEIMNAKKVRIAKDGRIFLGVLNTVDNPIYTINPDNLGEWTPVFQGTLAEDGSGFINNAEGGMVAAPSAAFDVVGEGKDFKLVNLGSKSGLVYAFGNYTCYEYPLGNADTWSDAASAEVMPLSLQYTISSQSVSVAYDKDGKGIWYVQYRSAPTEAQPAIKHATLKDGEWEEDYSDITTVARGGGVAYNKDYTLLAIPADQFKLNVYEVSKDAEGKPVLTVKYTVNTTTLRGFNDICFDYANNIYTCDNGKEVMQQIQLPLENPTVDVPCPKTELFRVGISTGVTEVGATEANKAQKVIENGQVVIIKGDKKYNLMGVEIK